VSEWTVERFIADARPCWKVIKSDADGLPTIVAKVYNETDARRFAASEKMVQALAHCKTMLLQSQGVEYAHEMIGEIDAAIDAAKPEVVTLGPAARGVEETTITRVRP